MNNLNIEQDFVLTNTWQGGTPAAAIAAAQPQVAPPVTIPATPTTPTTNSINVVGTLATVTPTSQPSSTPASSSVNATSPNSFASLFANSWSAWNAG